MFLRFFHSIWAWLGDRWFLPFVGDISYILSFRISFSLESPKFLSFYVKVGFSEFSSNLPVFLLLYSLFCCLFCELFFWFLISRPSQLIFWWSCFLFYMIFFVVICSSFSLDQIFTPNFLSILIIRMLSFDYCCFFFLYWLVLFVHLRFYLFLFLFL